MSSFDAFHQRGFGDYYYTMQGDELITVAGQPLPADTTPFQAASLLQRLATEQAQAGGAEAASSSGSSGNGNGNGNGSGNGKGSGSRTGDGVSAAPRRIELQVSLASG